MPKIIDDSGNILIEESEMKFGYYSTNSLFHLEESQIYQKIQNFSVSTAEFALAKKNNNQVTVLIFEAKKTAPKLLTEEKLEDFIKKARKNIENLDKNIFIDNLYKKVKHDNYFDDIQAKFNDTLVLFAAIYLNLHTEAKSEAPKDFQNLEFSNINFVLLLIVKNHQTEWLTGLQSKLQKKLKPLVKIWNLSPTSIEVLNEELAKKRGYIVND